MKFCKKVQISLFFFCLFCIIGCLPSLAQASNLRVYLGSVSSSCSITVAEGSYEIQGGTLANTTLATAQKGDTIQITKVGTILRVSINNSTIGDAYNGVFLLPKDDTDLNLLRYQNTRYRGSFSILSNGYILNMIDMEDYLPAVIGREIGYSVPMEALKAQAVASRSYAFSNIGSNTYYDVPPPTSSQVYGGYDAEIAANNQNVVEAVEATANQVLYYGNTLVMAVFHSHAGGYTEDNENVWGGTPLPYLRGVPSPYDSVGSTVYDEWTVTYTPAEMKSLAEAQMKRNGQSGNFGEFKELKLYTTNQEGSGNTVSGRVTKAEIVGTGCTVTATGDSIRTMLDLRSTLFTATGSVTTTTVAADSEVYVLNAAGNKVKRSWRDLFAIGQGGTTEELKNVSQPTVRNDRYTYSLGGESSSNDSQTITITGKGYGHGLGMSQYGAIGMAQEGYDYQEILRHYYGGDEPNQLTIKTKD